MTFALALTFLFAVAMGVVVAHANGPGGSTVLRWAVFVQLVAAVAAALALDLGSVLVPVLVGLASSFLAGGYVWRRSPLLDGEGYWFRVWFVLKDRGDLQAAENERRERLAATA